MGFHLLAVPVVMGALLTHASPCSSATSCSEDEQVKELRDTGAPTPLVDALQAAITASPDQARLSGTSVHVIEHPEPSPGAEPDETVFSYASSRFGSRRDAAARKARLRAHAEMLNAAWSRAFDSVAFPDLLEGAQQSGRVQGVEDHGWIVGAFACHLSVGPLREVILDKDALEETWVTYHERLESSARIAATKKDWEAVRLRLKEHLSRRPLSERAEVLQLQLLMASQERERAIAGAASLLQAWLRSPTSPLALLDLADLFLDLSDYEGAKSSIRRARQLLEGEQGGQ